MNQTHLFFTRRTRLEMLVERRALKHNCATALFEKWQEFMEIDPFTEAPVVNNFKTLQ